MLRETEIKTEQEWRTIMGNNTHIYDNSLFSYSNYIDRFVAFTQINFIKYHLSYQLQTRMSKNTQIFHANHGDISSIEFSFKTFVPKISKI